MHPIFVDIENEFLEIATEAEGLSNRLTRLDVEGPITGFQIYTCCERVMARLASDIDGAPVTRSDGWHVAPLRRMARPYPGRRPAIISAECYGLLDKLRSFRHRERNSYGVRLDFEIVVERSREAVAGLSMFRDEVLNFVSDGDIQG